MMDGLRSYLQHRIETFSWIDPLEFVLIGIAVYALYRFLRGTRGARVFRGFILLFVAGSVLVQLLTSALNLERVAIIYSALIQLAIVAAVIIFQPELRRALIQLGQNRLFRPFLKKHGLAFIDILTSTVEKLSRDKIGALVAIERDTGLLSLVETGRLLHAELSEELLVTIFWPGSPLHDMGVIVRQNQIVAAGCEFPLTQNPPLGTKYGARHRAALGLSEESDALIIVVSEETGEISIAHSGQFTEDMTVLEFRQHLANALVREQASAEIASAMGMTSRTSKNELTEAEEASRQ